MYNNLRTPRCGRLIYFLNDAEYSQNKVQFSRTFHNKKMLFRKHVSLISRNFRLKCQLEFRRMKKATYTINPWF